jgi:uncharacterized protein (TIGR03790 family)
MAPVCFLRDFAECRRLNVNQESGNRDERKGKPSLHLLLLLFLSLMAPASVAADPSSPSLAAMTVVVYNKAADDSASLARFYAKQRGILRDHLVALTCPPTEEISREEYDTTIAEPLREAFEKRHWWTLHESADGTKSVSSTSIRFVAVIRGVPLKIRATTTPYPGDKPDGGPINNRNEASVDSEIAALGFFTPQISGLISNPYFQDFRFIADFDNPLLLLVCRLDAPTAATVRRMIVDGVAAEKSGLWGRGYVDGAHNAASGLKVGDDWMAHVVVQLRKVGVPVVYEDTPAVFPDGYPMSDCALYYGWYAGGVTGPFTQRDFRFVPGAVAVHIHSYSASTLRNPNSGWAGPLVSRGAAATLGNVYEPYLQLTTHLDLFNDRLIHGFTFAESAYMATPAISWMNVMVGDPLYRPYASWLQLEIGRDSSKHASNWTKYHDFAVKNISRPDSEYLKLARFAASRACNGPMLEDLGGMEEAKGNFASATSYFLQARACYSKRDDILRVVLEEANGWIKQGKPKRALDLVRSTLRIVPDAPAAPLLRKIEQELTAPPPPTPKPSPEFP